MAEGSNKDAEWWYCEEVLWDSSRSVETSIKKNQQDGGILEERWTGVHECCKKEMNEQGEVETSPMGNLSKGISKGNRMPGLL